MKITVQVVLHADDDTQTVVREVFTLTRGAALAPETLGCEWSNYLAHLDRAIWRYPRPVTTLWRAHTASGDRPGRPMPDVSQIIRIRVSHLPRPTTAVTPAVMSEMRVDWVYPTGTAVSVAPTAATGSHRPRPGRNRSTAAGVVVGGMVYWVAVTAVTVGARYTPVGGMLHASHFPAPSTGPAC